MTKLFMNPREGSARCALGFRVSPDTIGGAGGCPGLAHLCPRRPTPPHPPPLPPPTHPPRSRKRAASEVKKRSKDAQKSTGIRAKLLNARRYKEHKRAVSVVQCSDVDGGAGGALMHLLPAAVSPALVLCAPDDDPNGEPVPVQVTRADGRPVLQTTLCASCRDALRKAERPKARRAGPACGRGAPSTGSFYAPTC